MNHHTLREIAKVASGLVLADIISAVWFSAAGLLPLTILGVTWTSSSIPEIIVFDGALLLFLIHFGWNMKLPIASPSERSLLIVAGVIFLVVAVAHLVRLAFGLDLILGNADIPLWLSWVGVLITGYLSYSCFHFAGMRARRR